MGCNESFTTSTAAITNDSDPRLLRFQQLNNDVPTNLGTTLDMALISKPVVIPGTPAILGPIVSQLTGGTTGGGAIDNSIALVLQPPTTPDVVASEMRNGAVRWLINCTDGFTLPIVIAESDFLSLCAAQGASSASSFTLNISTYANVAAIVGKTIDSVDYTTLSTWTTTNSRGIKYASSFFQIFLNAANVGAGLFLESGDGGSAGPGIGITVPPSPLMNLTVSIVTNDPAVDVTINVPINATQILAHATGPQAASQGATILMGVDASAYIGWTLHTLESGFLGTYGPATANPPSFIQPVIINPGAEYVGPSQPINSTAIGMNTITLDRVIGAGFDLGFVIQMYPRNIAPTPDTNGPIVVTEPYELRNRNQAAFRLVVNPPSSYDTEVSYNYVIRCYASQGVTAHGQFWTPVPTCVFDENAAATPGNGQVIAALNHIDGMPFNYGGTIVAIPIGAFSGPWNYIRFLFEPITVGEGGTLPNFTGWSMQIIANAREL
jgi:hypothetical protein